MRDGFMHLPSSRRPLLAIATLDHYQVRKHTAWYRHVTSAMCACAWLAVTASHPPPSEDSSGAGHGGPVREGAVFRPGQGCRDHLAASGNGPLTGLSRYHNTVSSSLTVDFRNFLPPGYIGCSVTMLEQATELEIWRGQRCTIPDSHIQSGCAVALVAHKTRMDLDPGCRRGAAWRSRLVSGAAMGYSGNLGWRGRCFFRSPHHRSPAQARCSTPSAGRPPARGVPAARA